jgi:hypothetical protein
VTEDSAAFPGAQRLAISDCTRCRHGLKEASTVGLAVMPSALTLASLLRSREDAEWVQLVLEYTPACSLAEKRMVGWP